jgi:hypothetical protein
MQKKRNFSHLGERRRRACVSVPLYCMESNSAFKSCQCLDGGEAGGAQAPGVVPAPRGQAEVAPHVAARPYGTRQLRRLRAAGNAWGRLGDGSFCAWSIRHLHRCPPPPQAQLAGQGNEEEHHVVELLPHHLPVHKLERQCAVAVLHARVPSHPQQPVDERAVPAASVSGWPQSDAEQAMRGRTVRGGGTQAG